MKSFHGDKAVKAKYLARLKDHHKKDQIIQGTGFEKGRGCAVGCTLDNYNHKAYEIELGLPEWLARLEDKIFEGLPKKEAPKFAVDFLLSIPVGVNVERVRWQFCAFILRQEIERVLLLEISDALKEQVVSSIRGVLFLHDESIRTGIESESAARSAESAARSAAWSAARSAAWSAARSAESAARSAESAESAAWSAVRSAESAAWGAESAAWSAARSAESAARGAESAAYQCYAKELLCLLKSTKPIALSSGEEKK